MIFSTIKSETTFQIPNENFYEGKIDFIESILKIYIFDEFKITKIKAPNPKMRNLDLEIDIDENCSFVIEMEFLEMKTKYEMYEMEEKVWAGLREGLKEILDSYEIYGPMRGEYKCVSIITIWTILSLLFSISGTVICIIDILKYRKKKDIKKNLNFSMLTLRYKDKVIFRGIFLVIFLILFSTNIMHVVGGTTYNNSLSISRDIPGFALFLLQLLIFGYILYKNKKSKDNIYDGVVDQSELMGFVASWIRENYDSGGVIQHYKDVRTLNCIVNEKPQNLSVEDNLKRLLSYREKYFERFKYKMDDELKNEYNHMYFIFAASMVLKCFNYVEINKKKTDIVNEEITRENLEYFFDRIETWEKVCYLIPGILWKKMEFELNIFSYLYMLLICETMIKYDKTIKWENLEHEMGHVEEIIKTASAKLMKRGLTSLISRVVGTQIKGYKLQGYFIDELRRVIERENSAGENENLAEVKLDEVKLD